MSPFRDPATLGRSVVSSEDRPFRGVTLRAIGVGLLVAVAAALWSIHSETIARTSRLNLTQFPLSLAAVFFVLVLVLNPALALLRRGWELTRSELLVALGMGLVAATIPTAGLTSLLLGMLAIPFYHATPENQWDLYFLGHIPEWLAPRDTGLALTHLFEGLPHGASIPWGVWLLPLFWWGSLIAAVAAFCFGVAVILRRPWVEEQRLAYPLLTPTVTLTEGLTPGSFWSDTVRSRLFWGGFAIAFAIGTWNYFSFAFPTVPRLPSFLLGRWFPLGRYAPPLWTKLNLYTVGFGYFVDLDILLGFLVFNAFFTAEIALFRRVGYQIGRDVGVFGYLWKRGGWGNPETAWQCFGALTFLVLWGFYVARRHLAGVLRKALDTSHPVDDAGEMLSYRAAVGCSIAGLAYTLFWLHAAGLELRVLLPFLFALLIVYVGLARFVAEGGILYAYSPMSPQEFAVRLNGTASVSGSSMTLLTFAFVLRGNGPGLLLPSLTQIVRLGDLVKEPGRRFVGATILALFVAFLTSVSTTLYFGYTEGAANHWDLVFKNYPTRFFNRALSHIRNPSDIEWAHFAFFGVGAGIMAVLTYLRFRFPWWPLHPIGFPVAGTDCRSSIVSLFLIWGIKSIVLRVGGARFYRRGVPLFIGILVGHAAAVFLYHWMDQIWFPRGGHHLHGW